MKRPTETWVIVAEIDFHTATLAAEAPRPILESVCFHAQQCTEKYLKAILEESDRRVPHIHDLSRLLTLVEHLVPELDRLRAGIDALVPYASVLRYPHDPIEIDELTEIAADAFRTMVETRRLVRAFLDIEDAFQPAT